jgi:hypothetical protein
MGSQEASGWLGIFAKYPDLTAACVGLVLSWFATQFIKGIIKDEVPLSRYRLYVRLVGFFTGWFFAYGAWRILDPTATKFENFYFSAGIGFASPGLYSIVIPYLRSKFPVFEKLSGRPDSETPK